MSNEIGGIFHKTKSWNGGEASPLVAEKVRESGFEVWECRRTRISVRERLTGMYISCVIVFTLLSYKCVVHLGPVCYRWNSRICQIFKRGNKGFATKNYRVILGFFLFKN